MKLRKSLSTWRKFHLILLILLIIGAKEHACYNSSGFYGFYEIRPKRIQAPLMMKLRKSLSTWRKFHLILLILLIIGAKEHACYNSSGFYGYHSIYSKIFRKYHWGFFLQPYFLQQQS